MNKNQFKSGFVTIIGQPNAGKSSLINRLVGENIAITSRKPQTTRKNLKGILTDDDSQIIFVDTPGIHKGRNKLDEYMELSIKKALEDIDLILYILDIKNTNYDIIKKDFDKIKKYKHPKVLILNKIDLDDKNIEREFLEIYKEDYIKDIFNDIVLISALKNKNIDLLITKIKKYLPYGPMFFDSEQLTDEPIKNIVAEYIRQQCLYKLKDEVPHSITVIVDKMIEKKEITHIYATIICEKDTQKGIIIGKSGSMLKNIGTAARISIEKLLNQKVNLKLYVTVKNNWRDEMTNLINYGFNKKRI